MSLASRHPRRLRLSRKERVLAVLLFLAMIAVVLIAMYLGLLLLEKEEQQDRSDRVGSELLPFTSVSQADRTQGCRNGARLATPLPFPPAFPAPCVV